MQVDGKQVPVAMVGSRINISNASDYDYYFMPSITGETQMLGILQISFVFGSLALLLYN